MSIEKAAESLGAGRMIIVYDGEKREGEADLMFHPSFVSPEKIEMLRKEGGGLICVAMDGKIAQRLGLPFYTDILADSGLEIKKMECKKTAYKDKPSFAIAVNHKEVYTGITDNDRALTIRKLSELADCKEAKQRFMTGFYSPGHVFLLVGRGIGNRQGHTELGIALANKAGLSGMIVLCEMLGKGKALSKEGAEAFARKHDLIFVEGKEVVR